MTGISSALVGITLAHESPEARELRAYARWELGSGVGFLVRTMEKDAHEPIGERSAIMGFLRKVWAGRNRANCPESR